MIMSRAKMAEPIEIPTNHLLHFEIPWAHGNVLDGDPDPLT